MTSTDVIPDAYDYDNHTSPVRKKIGRNGIRMTQADDAQGCDCPTILDLVGSGAEKRGDTYYVLLEQMID